MDKIWDRKSFEVGGHWPLWRWWKTQMTTQNRQKSNDTKKKLLDSFHPSIYKTCVRKIHQQSGLAANYIKWTGHSLVDPLLGVITLQIHYRHYLYTHHHIPFGSLTRAWCHNQGLKFSVNPNMNWPIFYLFCHFVFTNITVFVCRCKSNVTMYRLSF